MTQTPNLAMAYLVSSQAQKEVTHNDALNDLDVLVQANVIDRVTATPPVSPNAGDAYIIGASATGAWSGFSGSIAAYYNGWKIKTPESGWRAYVKSENKIVVFNGSSWGMLSAPFSDATWVWAPAAIANNAGVSSAVQTVSGAALGDFVSVAAPCDLQGVTATAYVSAANCVVVRLQNLSGATVTLASGTWRVRVTKA